MADEWSKPVKDGAGGWECQLQLAGPDGMDILAVRGNRVSLSHSGSYITAPRDVVLRLLAAEASDRLGWVWSPLNRTAHGYEMNATDASCEPLEPGEVGEVTLHYLAKAFTAAAGEEVRVYIEVVYVDELLAAMHGRFLLADALRETGQ